MQADIDKSIAHALALMASADVGTERVAQRARRQLAIWRAESAQNEAACREAEKRWRLIGSMAPGLAAQFSEPASGKNHGKPNGLQRRALLSLGMAGAGVGLLAWRFYPHEEQVQFAKNYQTDTAQLLKIALPDGSQIHLNAKTSLGAALYRNRRNVRLLNGEARFDVAHNAGRPFVVTTPSGSVEVVGTVFSVAERGGLMSVLVEHGHVRVRPLVANTVDAEDSMQAQAVDLRAGDSLTIRDGVPGAIRRVDVADAAAWRSGWLVFDNTRLDEAMPAINAFLGAPLLLESSAGALRLTGRFRANDPQSLLAALPAILPVTVSAQTGGGARISAH